VYTFVYLYKATDKASICGFHSLWTREAHKSTVPSARNNGRLPQTPALSALWDPFYTTEASLVD